MTTRHEFEPYCYFQGDNLTHCTSNKLVLEDCRPTEEKTRSYWKCGPKDQKGRRKCSEHLNSDEEQTVEYRCNSYKLQPLDNYQPPDDSLERLKKYRDAEEIGEGKYLVKEEEQVESEIQVSTREYIVKPGDTLSKIAQQELGGGHRWKYLHAINKGRISDPNKLRPGQKLIIPVE